MKTVLRAVRLLEVVLLVGYVRCQDGFSEQDLLRLQQLSSNDGQIETITSYSTNLVHRDPSRNEQSVSAVSVQYHLTDEPEKNEDSHRANHGRSDNRRKIFHMKNPFQRQLDQNSERQIESFSSQDSDTGASNQYSAIQYSLPPEEFLQQMRAENQYLQQFSTPEPSVSYTVTPQPQYQYNNVHSQNGYEGTQPTNQLSQLDQKIGQQQAYHSNPNSLQYIAQPNSYSSENTQSTPSPVPPYLSTSSNQYVGTPANSQSYVSSASPVYLSSPSNIAQYVTSPVTAFQTGSPDYVNRVTTSGNSYNYDNNESIKKMQIDHYDNAGNGIRYPFNVQQQYQNEIPSTTLAPPSSTPYPDSMRDAWQNAMNAGVDSLSKSLHEASMLSRYQNSLQNNNNQQEARQDTENTDTHRVGNNVASANNMFMNYVQPDYNVYNNIKSRTRDTEQETGQPEIFSHGDYGWKLSGKKSVVSPDNYGSASYSPYRQYIIAQQSDNQANYQSEQQKPQQYYAYNPHRMAADAISLSSKIASENEAQEFAKAAAKAQENMKQQQSARINENYYLNNYAPSFSANGGVGSSNLQSQSNVVSTFYGNTDRHKTKYLADDSNLSPYTYGNTQSDLITATPFYYASSRDSSVDPKTRQPFDHAKALKNIVPIDVSNVVQNSEAALKAASNLDSNTRYNIQNFPKDQMEQSLKQAYRPLADAYYKDKNTGYGFNIKSKPDDIITADGVKQLDQNIIYYNKHQHQEPSYSQNLFSDAKRYADGSTQQINYLPQITNNYQDNLSPPNNIQQSIQRPLQQQSDIATFLKLNDIPYRFTQGLSSDALKLHNNNFDHGSIPQPIPGRINQNVGSHQLDVTNSILHKLLNKQTGINYRPNEIDPQTGGLLSTIHGFRVANPYNVDLKLVADMLKGKTTVNENHIASIREQYNKPLPLKLDMSALQHLLIKNDNYGNLSPLSDGLSSIGNPYSDPYNTGRFPYQGAVKYSRSQEEEEETILPIAESSNTHPIGAVMEQDDSPNVHEDDSGTELIGHDDDKISANNFGDSRHKSIFNRDHKNGPRHPNSLIPGRHPYHRKYPKHDIGLPYPLLKPPPHPSRSRMPYNKDERRGRRRRITKPKIARILKTEPLFEAESTAIQSDLESPVPILLRPPPPVAEEKTAVVDEKQSS